MCAETKVRGAGGGVTRVCRLSLALLAGLLVTLVSPAGAQLAEPGARVALVIGNGAYREAAIAGAAEQAREVADTLRQRQFDVVTAENATRAEMERAITTFAGKLQRDSVAVVFYAGHAAQFRNRNFLLPVDAGAVTAQDAARTAIDLDLIVDPLIVGRLRSAVVVLDAGRPNPWQTATSRGLAPVERIEGVAVAVTAAPGKPAPANPRSANPAVAEWLKAIRTPGLEMATALQRTREQVARLGRGEHQFWTSAAPAKGLIVSQPGQAGTLVAQNTRAVIISGQGAANQPAEPGKADSFELAFWESIRNSENAAEYRAYLNAYPAGRFAALARTREQLYAGKRSGQAVASAAQELPRPAPTPSAVLRDCEGCPEMILIPAGRFEMGAGDAFEFEKPVHPVAIRNAFFLGTREVTFEEWDACVDQGGCSQRPNDRGLGRGKRPVTDIDWNDANAYAAWLSVKTGRKYRLPTESEWEYAARAGAPTAYSWGKDIDRDKANCLGCNAEPRKQTIEVGRFPPNAFGLYDMAGNAAEWVADCWSESYRGAPADGSALTRAGCRERVLRGGSFNNDPRYLRSAARFKYEADVRFYTNGFRVARES